jgi:hypothetical protein
MIFFTAFVHMGFLKVILIETGQYFVFVQISDSSGLLNSLLISFYFSSGRKDFFVFPHRTERN